MSKTTVIYEDIAPGAAEDASVETSGYTDFSNVDILPAGTDNNPVISAELNAWLLNGQAVTYDTDQIAFWSEELCGDDCAFENPPVITLTMEQQYSSVGITLIFNGDSWATDVKISWYQGDALLNEEAFTPDSLTFFCEAQVLSYNKIVIAFNAMSLPGRRMKLDHIVFGLRREFGMSELRSASITNETSLISTELPVSTFDWTLDSDADVGFMFQLKQPVSALNNNTLIGVYYIDSFSRSAATVYAIQCYDAFGVLDESMFSGGVYSSRSAMSLISEILDGDFVLEYDDDVTDVSLTGIIEYSSKRNAMQQVLFAWGVCASTDGRETIRIFYPGDDPTQLDEDHTMQGVTVETDSIVTQVSVTAHTYTENENGSIEFDGVKYEDTKTVFTVSNPNVTASDKQNVVEITDATLISTAIGAATAQRVYDYYLRRNTTSASIVWSREQLGDCVALPNAWDGTQTGNISKMEIKLSNTVVAGLEVIGS